MQIIPYDDYTKDSVLNLHNVNFHTAFLYSLQ